MQVIVLFKIVYLFVVIVFYCTNGVVCYVFVLKGLFRLEGILRADIDIEMEGNSHRQCNQSIIHSGFVLVCCLMRDFT